MNVMAMGIDELRIAVQTLRPHAAEAQRLEQELASIRGDIVEYVMDGREFDWVEAVIAIRAWREAAEGLQAIVDKLDKMADNVLFAEYVPAPGTTAWCLWRYEDANDWLVSRCHAPEDSDEIATGFGWIVEDCDDECEIGGIFSSLEAAEAAMKEASG